MFEQDDDAINKISQQQKITENNEEQSASTLNPIPFTYLHPIGNRDEFDYHFFDTTIECNNSTNSISREIAVEFLDSINNEKFNRLVREEIIKPSFKTIDNGCAFNAPPVVNMDNEQNERQFIDADFVQAINEHIRANAAATTTTASGYGRVTRRRYNQQIETRPEVLARRQKQIDYGKNTIGYENYIKLVPRNRRSKNDPWTPPKQYKYSRRAFDGLVKLWRTRLHIFDPPNASEIKDNYAGCRSCNRIEDDVKKF